MVKFANASTLYNYYQHPNMESKKRVLTIIIICLVSLLSEVKSIEEADKLVTIIPNNTVKLNCSVG